MAAACEVRAGVCVLQLWSAEDGIFRGEDPASGLCVSPALQPSSGSEPVEGCIAAWRSGARPAAGAGVLCVDVPCSSNPDVPRYPRAWLQRASQVVHSWCGLHVLMGFLKVFFLCVFR